MTRPDIYVIKTGDELKRWYWLKQELLDFCKRTQLSYVGTKFDILERVAIALNKGVAKTEKMSQTAKPISKFLWSKSLLSLDTVITDSYNCV